MSGGGVGGDESTRGGEAARTSAVPPAVSVAPRITTSTTLPSAVSICVLLERRPKPNFVDSSQPKETIRLQSATRKAAIASDATVSSPRNFCSSRSHGIGTSASGAYALITSAMFAATALGATRRPSCAQTRTRSFHGIAV